MNQGWTFSQLGHIHLFITIDGGGNVTGTSCEVESLGGGIRLGPNPPVFDNTTKPFPTLKQTLLISPPIDPGKRVMLCSALLVNGIPSDVFVPIALSDHGTNQAANGEYIVGVAMLDTTPLPAGTFGIAVTFGIVDL